MGINLKGSLWSVIAILLTGVPVGEVYAVRLEDGRVVRLTHNKWEDGTPTWAEVPR